MDKRDKNCLSHHMPAFSLSSFSVLLSDGVCVTGWGEKKPQLTYASSLQMLECR